MAKRKSDGNWKPLILEGAFTAKDLEGLIGIEELTDYTDAASSDQVTLGPTVPKKSKVKLENSLPKKRTKKKPVPGKYVRNPNAQNIEANESPGKYVRSPKLSKQATKKKKVELGVLTHADSKMTIDDLKAWSIARLPNPLLQALADLGFEKPTQIQELTLPPAILGRRDILGAAETGSGKTLAFGLPILSGIIHLKSKADLHRTIVESDHESDISDDNEDTGLVKCIDNVEAIAEGPTRPLYALILTPTRELAIQVHNHLKSVAKYTGIRIAVVLGGMSAEKQERILRKGPEIVVATPGRLWELLQNKNSHLSQIDSIKYLAIDETDRMLESGHYQELHQLLERLNVTETQREQRQNFVFSATLTLVHDLPRHLVLKKKMKARSSNKILNLTPGQKIQKIISTLGITNPKVVDVSRETGTVSSLTECKITCEMHEKDYFVYYFLQKHPGRTLIFCNSINGVKRLSSLLTTLKCHALPLHATMAQRQRLKNLERFRDDPLGTLVATDVAARGLDIPKVHHVLHYQIPRTSEGYVHRSGRTARASRAGLTVLLVEPDEMSNYVRLCRNLGRYKDVPVFSVSQSYLNAVKSRVNLARDLDKLELQMKRVNTEHGWLQKAAKDMDIIIDDHKLLSSCKDEEESSKWRKHANAKRRELTALLEKPLFPKGFSANYPTSCDQTDIMFVEGAQAPQKALDVMNQLSSRSKKTTHE